MAAVRWGNILEVGDELVTASWVIRSCKLPRDGINFPSRTTMVNACKNPFRRLHRRLSVQISTSTLWPDRDGVSNKASATGGRTQLTLK